MKKEYWFVIIVYLIMQFSSLIGVPILYGGFKWIGINPKLSIPYWLIVSFSIALILVLYLLREEIKESRADHRGQRPGSTVLWGIFGVFLALFAQSVAANIERLLGIKMGSENTQEIINIINTLPLAILVSSIFGPILEEIIFRKIIFGSLYKRFNFFISALISSVIFALAHMDPTHILIYASMGFTFAFLYVKTKNILVPIIAHVSMNTLVVLVQSAFRNDIEKVIHNADKIQNFIGGFL